MTGLANTLTRTELTLEERGLPADSYFTITFRDGSSITEKEVQWSTICEMRKVGYFGGKKVVFVCTLPVARIEIHHDNIDASMDVPEGCEAYQAATSEALLINGGRRDRVLGRVIGIVKDGEILEERIADGQEHSVQGMKK